MTNVIFEGPDAVPTGYEESDTPSDSEYSCEICGFALAYSGRGRKPKKCTINNGGRAECFGINDSRSSSGESRSPRSSSKKVEQALAVMAGSYDQITQLLVFTCPSAAMFLEEKIEAQQARNKMAFEASPALAERVAGWGGKGGTLAFALSNLALVATVARIAVQEMNAQKEGLATLVNMMNNGDVNGGAPDLSRLFGL